MPSPLAQCVLRKATEIDPMCLNPDLLTWQDGKVSGMPLSP